MTWYYDGIVYRVDYHEVTIVFKEHPSIDEVIANMDAMEPVNNVGYRGH